MQYRINLKVNKAHLQKNKFKKNHCGLIIFDEVKSTNYVDEDELMALEKQSKQPYFFKLISGQFNIEAPSYLSPDKKIAILLKLESSAITSNIRSSHVEWNVQLDFPYHFRYG